LRRNIYWTQGAVEQFFDLLDRDHRTRKQILNAVRGFAADNRGDIKKLSGRDDEWRLRVGDWRVCFSLDSRTVTIVSIDNRRDAYK
jgi:mRNA-degrading endonuclease RelE of RelBE toxin-antitoxin system